MRRIRSLALTATLLIVAVPGHAATLDTNPNGTSLREARTERATARARLRTLRERFERLKEQYSSLAEDLGRASIDLLDAMEAEQEAKDRLADARVLLAGRVREAYMQGPGSALEAFLSATSIADLAAVQEFNARTMAADTELIVRLRGARIALRDRRAEAERARATLLPKERAIGSLLDRMRQTLDEAERAAEEAGLKVAALARERRTIDAASALEVGRDIAGTFDLWTTQRDLLALLGPSQGRGCEIPPGLQDTGKRFSGLASWYGWDLAGSGTASGPPFDPRLFTVANRWLPFGVFLRVHYEGRCAIVLVNDRGPYGDYDRVIDLSWAAAEYLGVGVSPVTIDILVPGT